MSNRKKILLVGGSFGAILLILLMLFFGNSSASGFFGGNFFRIFDRKIEVPTLVAEVPLATVTQVVPTEVVVDPTQTPEPTNPPVPAPTATEVVIDQGPFGPNPEDFPAGVNMLTGEFASDPETLGFMPALVSITNWPITARPQAGLGSASFVYELYIGQGMSRFLSLFYGEFPGAPNGDSDEDVAMDNTSAYLPLLWRAFPKIWKTLRTFMAATLKILTVR